MNKYILCFSFFLAGCSLEMKFESKIPPQREEVSIKAPTLNEEIDEKIKKNDSWRPDVTLQ